LFLYLTVALTEHQICIESFLGSFDVAFYSMARNGAERRYFISG
jgi:hypothetical protein